MSNRSWSIALVLVGLATLLVMVVGVALAELPAGGTFIDDDGNIEAIAAVGITKGCNPPANNKYCPDKSLTRGQMAAFVRRALGLPSSSTDFFVDDDDSVFEDDINAIAAEGITKGCNPSVNDKFCPDGKIGRGQMASFFARALGLAPIIPPPPTTVPPPGGDQGSGQGDYVVNLSIADVPVVVELSHDGTSNFIVWSLDTNFEQVDLLVNEIGAYDGIRLMQAAEDEPVAALEIKADGNWAYEIRPLAEEPDRTCPVVGTGDSVIVLPRFDSSSTAAALTHNGSSNFYIWAWNDTDRGLLVNEIGSYTGTVLVSKGFSTWEISADGKWTVNC